jgi:hypothetical protein
VDVQIESPLVPMESLRSPALLRYHNHYFLEPDWQPAVQGQLAKLLKWCKQR